MAAIDSHGFGVLKPVDHVVISFASARQADAATLALATIGLHGPNAVRRLSDREMLQQIDAAIGSPKLKVFGGEQVRVRPQASAEELSFRAENIELDILFEDDALLVINKPPGLVVHPGSGNWEGTMLNALLHHAPPLKHLPRAGIVHRLDKDTSGLLVVAKTLEAQTNLVRQLQGRSVKREYLAVAEGVIEAQKKP